MPPAPRASWGGRPASAVIAVLPNRAPVRSLGVGIDVSVAAPVAVLAGLPRVFVEGACWVAGVRAAIFPGTGSSLGESKAEIMPRFVFRRWSDRTTRRESSVVVVT
eukprot:5713779-Pyramimonas_sp.AAC.1